MINSESENNTLSEVNCTITDIKEEIEKKSNVNSYITNKQLIQLVNEAFGLPKEESYNSEINKKSNIFNIISLGSSSVGKTSILYRLLNEKFEDDYKATMPSDKTFPYFVKYKGQKYQLFFYDTFEKLV